MLQITRYCVDFFVQFQVIRLSEKTRETKLNKTNEQASNKKNRVCNYKTIKVDRRRRRLWTSKINNNCYYTNHYI